MPREIRVGPPVATRAGDAWRVSADVDGDSVWFESSDTPLAASPEAFASAFLLPSLAHRRRLSSAAPLDAVWLANAPRLVEIFHRWWRYPRLVPLAAPAPAAVGGPGRERASFFSGGVDSFHTLRFLGQRIDRLVFVVGFDIPRTDTARAEASLAGVRAVAAAAGAAVTVVRTNLREHPLVRSTSWERANGGALAAIGHLLSGRIEEIVVPSSIAVAWGMQWGSHWETDPLFSSSRLTVREFGEERVRLEKVREIANDPLAQEHLRVCWENRTATGNCSRCGKCVITRLMLASAGALDRFPVFAGTATLAADVDALPHDSHHVSMKDLLTRGDLPPELHRATAALQRRSDHARSFPVRTRRALLGMIRKAIGADRPRGR